MRHIKALIAILTNKKCPQTFPPWCFKVSAAVFSKHRGRNVEGQTIIKNTMVFFAFLSLLSNYYSFLIHLSPQNYKHEEKSIIQLPFFQFILKYWAFVSFLCQQLLKMLHLSVPKHFHRGVSKFWQPFVTNTAVDMFWGAFLIEIPVCLALWAHITTKFVGFLGFIQFSLRKYIGLFFNTIPPHCTKQ